MSSGATSYSPRFLFLFVVGVVRELSVFEGLALCGEFDVLAIGSSCRVTLALAVSLHNGPNSYEPGPRAKIREEGIVCLCRRSSCGLSSYVVVVDDDDDDRSRCAFPLDFRDAVLFG